MLSIKLFRLVFCLFRFNRKIETLCFGIEAKQPKQTFWFRLFRIETSFEGHPTCILAYPLTKCKKRIFLCISVMNFA
jgi:hypothetical protein